MHVAWILSATYSTSGAIEPSERGGVASTIVLHPATCAGTPSMSDVDGKTALPPGTYKPTLSIARGNRVQTTPGIVVTSMTSSPGAHAACLLGVVLAGAFCASWNDRTFAYATSMASRVRASIACLSASVWNGGRRTVLSSCTRSSCAVKESTASSPRSLTAARMGRTRSMTCVVRIAGRRSSSICCAADVSLRRCTGRRIGAEASNGSLFGI